MPKFHGKTVRVYYDLYDLSGDNHAVSAGVDYDTGEVTAFGDANKNYVVGLGANSDIAYDGFFNNTASHMHPVGTAYLGGTAAKVFTAVGGTTQGMPAFAGSALWTSLNAPITVGNAAVEQAKFVAGGQYGVDPGKVLEYMPSTSSGTGAALQDGTAATTAGLRGYINVLSVTAAVTAKIQHGTAAGGPWVDLVTFTAAAAGTSEGQAATGTVNAFLRRNFTAGSAQAIITFRRL